MAPNLSEDEADDLIYLARTGDQEELTTSLTSLASRENVSPAEILISAKDEGKSTCLHMAAANGHLATVKLLLSHFANRPQAEKQAFLDAPNEYGNTGLHWASLSGHLPVVKLLVESGASVAIANNKEYVPLDLASFNDKVDVVDYFLKQSGDLENENNESSQGEGLAAAVGDVEMDDGDDVDEKDKKESVSSGSEKEKGGDR
ncbi:ankyrin repeat-containing protein YAR1 [Echria macrotheca]|uniref:Ankyrin repeat-containing protein YAR1 n=1 Tax=Echria macrotheca TaxID=438768 RepID=A0AAJ0BH86_9PEZI|nr:ankyrin repeat-containing protein YAR1 [Echria macrotheca]